MQELDNLTRKEALDGFAEMLASYRRLVRPSVTDDMADGILQLCVAVMDNFEITAGDLMRLSQEVARKRGLDADALESCFIEFVDFLHKES